MPFQKAPGNRKWAGVASERPGHCPKSPHASAMSCSEPPCSNLTHTTDRAGLGPSPMQSRISPEGGRPRVGMRGDGAASLRPPAPVCRPAPPQQLVLLRGPRLIWSFVHRRRALWGPTSPPGILVFTRPNFPILQLGRQRPRTPIPIRQKSRKLRSVAACSPGG